MRARAAAPPCFRLNGVALLSRGEPKHEGRCGEKRRISRRGRRARRSSGAGGTLVGRADPALPAQLHSRRRAAPLGPAGDPRVRPLEKVRGAGEPRARATAEGEGRTHRPRSSGRHRRQARRRVSAGRISDRLGHPVQHERQRGHRQPGDPDRRRRHRIQEADPSQRRRQSQSVVERRVPDRDAHRRRSDRSRKRCCRPSRSCAIRSTTRRRRFQTS